MQTVMLLPKNKMMLELRCYLLHSGYPKEQLEINMLIPKR